METPTTSWSLILEAADTQAEGAADALARFCEQYWPPVYGFFRRKGHDRDAAADLTQSFFARLIEHHSLGEADPARGRFRSFLFTCANNFSVNERERERAQKRGGAARHVSFDPIAAEEQYASSLAGSLTPEQAFHRRWALDLIDKAVARLRDEHTGDRARLHEALAPYLLDADGRIPYDEISQRLGMTEGALRVAAHRLRKRFGQVLRLEIGRTVASPNEIEDELRFLIRSV